MPPIDWLVLTLHQPDERQPAALDPIRIQKALFYISRSDIVPNDEKYEFEPYNYGPYSKQIYVDLDSLVSDHTAAPVMDTSNRWSRYALTRQGQNRAMTFAAGMPSPWVELVTETRGMVTSLSFKALLRQVYRDYPAFAEKSIANV